MWIQRTLHRYFNGCLGSLEWLGQGLLLIGSSHMLGTRPPLPLSLFLVLGMHLPPFIRTRGCPSPSTSARSDCAFSAGLLPLYEKPQLPLSCTPCSSLPNFSSSHSTPSMHSTSLPWELPLPPPLPPRKKVLSFNPGPRTVPSVVHILNKKCSVMEPLFY